VGKNQGVALPAVEIWRTIHAEPSVNGVTALWLTVIVDVFITLRDGDGDGRTVLDFIMEDNGIFDLAALNLGLEPDSLRERLFAALSKQGSRCPGVQEIVNTQKGFDGFSFRDKSKTRDRSIVPFP
jgi:hypothetical protein